VNLNQWIICWLNYNADKIFYKIQDSKYAETALSREYYKIVNSYLKMPEFHMSWITGIWIPTGNLAIIGLHPEIGFQMGAKH